MNDFLAIEEQLRTIGEGIAALTLAARGCDDSRERAAFEFLADQLSENYQAVREWYYQTHEAQSGAQPNGNGPRAVT